MSTKIILSIIFTLIGILILYPLWPIYYYMVKQVFKFFINIFKRS